MDKVILKKQFACTCTDNIVISALEFFSIVSRKGEPVLSQ